MARNLVFLVHGMGNGWEDDAAAEITAIRETAARYPAVRIFASDLHFVPIQYNQVFADYLTRLEEEAGLLEGFLGEIPESDLAGQLRRYIEAAFGTGSGDLNLPQDLPDLRTHWLDVLLYRFTLLRHPVRISVANQILAELRKPENAQARGTRIAAIGHSLGSAVLHDALVGLYSLPGPGPIFGPQAPDDLLLGEELKQSLEWSCLAQLANVSRLLANEVDPSRSIVRPAQDATGVLSAMVTAKHLLDPIARIRPFRAAMGPLLATETAFHDVTLRAVKGSLRNIHGFEHYWRDPQVHIPFFRGVFGNDVVSEEEARDAIREYGLFPEELEELRARVEALREKAAGLSGPDAVIKLILSLVDAEAEEA